MARLARIVVPGLPHHVTQRGNRRMEIFFTPMALSRTLRDTHTAYASYINRREGVSGHLWQGRFFYSVLEDAHLWAAVRYVERNPVRAGLVTQAIDYPWSSAAAGGPESAPRVRYSSKSRPHSVCRNWLISRRPMVGYHSQS